MNPILVFEQLLNGAGYGLMLFLIAAGLTLVFGIMDVMNLSHGSLFMVGAYVAATVHVQSGSLAGAVLVAIAATMLVAVLLEVTLMRRLYGRDHLAQVLATFGVILVADDAVKMVWGPSPIMAPTPAALAGPVELFAGLPYPSYRLVVLGAGVLVAGLLYLLVNHSRVGMLVRAGASDRWMAELMGVRVKRVFSGIFLLGAALAALAGALMGPIMAVQVGMGESILIPALVVIVIGGIGSVRGAFVAALLVGLVDTIGRAFLPLVLLGALALFPLVAAALGLDFYIGFVRRVLVVALAAASLNFIMGFGGMVALGHAGFVGVGAYAVVMLSDAGVTSAWVVWAAAMALAALAALLIGAVSLRTRGVYFIMITLAFAQMLYFVFVSLRSYGGDDGYTLPMRPLLGLGLNGADESTLYWVVLALVALVLWCLDRATASRFGAALTGIRDNETRMRALGYPVYLLQLTAFVLAGAVAGLAGALLATGNSFVSQSMMHWTQSATLIVMVVIGGLGRRWGGPGGAAVWLTLEEVLKLNTDYWHMPLGALLIVTALYAPQGLAALADRRARSAR